MIFILIAIVTFICIIISCTGGNGGYLGGVLGYECLQKNQQCDSSYVQTNYDSVVTCCEADQFCRKATSTSTYETCN